LEAAIKRLAAVEKRKDAGMCGRAAWKVLLD